MRLPSTLTVVAALLGLLAVAHAFDRRWLGAVSDVALASMLTLSPIWNSPTSSRLQRSRFALVVSAVVLLEVARLAGRFH